MSPRQTPEDLWALHTGLWRHPAAPAGLWRAAGEVDPRLLEARCSSGWWELLEELGITLLITREYEHLAIGLSSIGGRPLATYWPLPHPSGLAVDRVSGRVHVACTRNPNQVVELRPSCGLMDRLDSTPGTSAPGGALVPVASRLYPGCLYMHDLAFVGGELHANAVGQNAVVRLASDGSHPAVWWPKSIDTPAGPLLGRNHIQLNSIAAGEDLRSSFFSASSERVGVRRPGQRNYPVDGRGVIFSGETRQPCVRGLTRPHSARLHQGAVWVDNSGYGELGCGVDGRFAPLVKLPGWTRGLCFAGNYAFVGVSRVIPRFRAYAPGLDVDKSSCGVFAVDMESGKIAAHMRWPWGNQIFGIDWLPTGLSAGFPLTRARCSTKSAEELFYAFQLS